MIEVKKDESSKQFDKAPNISYFSLYRFASKWDKVSIVTAVTATLLAGITLPYAITLVANIFQAMIDYTKSTKNMTSSDNDLLKTMNHFGIHYSLIGVVLFIGGYVGHALMNVAAINQILKIREAYLKAALNQDFAYFDIHHTGDFASKMAEDVMKLEEGIGDKVSTFVYNLSIGLSSVAMALAKGWKLALLCLLVTPLTILLVGLTGMLANKWYKKQSVVKGLASAVAEEAISSIKTVYAFNGQQKEIERYNKYLNQVTKITIKKELFTGLSMGCLYICVFASYALSFYFGTYLIVNEPEKYNADVMFSKDKLTFDAIPTEDGPYCDSTNYIDMDEDSSRLLSIVVDDIETDHMVGSDKRANFSMKYGDFLTNYDLMDVGKTDENNIAYKHNDINTDILQIFDGNDKDKFISHDGSFAFKLSLPYKANKKLANQPMLVVPPYINSSETKPADIVKNSEQGNKSKIPINSTQKKENKTVKIESNLKNLKKKPKITIISEKKITDPVPITGKFEPVEPNFVINVGKIKRSSRLNNHSNETSNNTSNKVAKVEESAKTVEIELSPEPVIEKIDSPQPALTKNQIKDSIVFENPLLSSLDNTKPSKASLLKPKVTPERVEAINKKRKFNMKLREVIESCLDKLESPDNVIRENPAEEINKSKEFGKPTRRVFSKPSVPSNQDFTIAFLESRLKKMENNLLEKIDQNTRKIVELKNTCMKKNTFDNKPTIQTRADEEAYKKQLFQEISKYLSPSSKSLVYEELFINKFALDETASEKRKRKRVI